jgi:DNA-binding transcriptional MerR regulator
MYTVRDFAARAGVTVRALHHYDELGLLKPLRKPQTGYRLYRDSDFARLEQIVVLKFLGIPLKEMRPLLTTPKTSNLRQALRRQQRVLAEKRHQLDAALAAIGRAEQALERTDKPDWNVFTHLVKEIEMHNETDWTKKYYSDQARSKLDARRQEWTPELQERVGRQWAELIADVEAAIARQENPQSAAAQALAARWQELLAAFTGGDPQVQHGLNRMWSDRENWPEGEAKSFRMPSAVTDFIQAALSGT